MEDRTALFDKLGERADVIWGDIAETVEPFIATVEPSSPIGFISVDVDIYSECKSSTWLSTSSPEKYTPAVSMYFDDVGFFFANAWAGELAAISEFNVENQFRKIDHDRSLPGHRPIKAEAWYPAMTLATSWIIRLARQQQRDSS